MRAGRKKGPQPVDIAVGQRIRVARVTKSMSQTALGEAIGVTFQQVQKYEKGMNRVGASRLQQIADVLDTTVTKLFAEPSTASEKVIALADTMGAHRLITAFNELKPYHRNLVVQVAEALSNNRRTE